MSSGPAQHERIIGRYAMFGEIAAGGMATVHLGKLLGPAGFARVVAIKRLHPQFAKDPEFVSMFLDEARLAGRIRHPNVVACVDVVALEGELLIVMDYVEGESLSRLRGSAGAAGEALPLPVAGAVMLNVLHGLHAAHETLDDAGASLGLVHRDVSPQNVLIGVDGIARVVDFGIAKAAGRLQSTQDGVVRGKIAYMAPEQLGRGPIDRRVDVYAASVVFWEMLAGRRLFAGDNDFQLADQIVNVGVRVPPSTLNPEVPEALSALVLRGASRNPDERFASALEMADALEPIVPAASARTVGRWVESLASSVLEQRAHQVREVEAASSSAKRLPQVAATTGARSHDAHTEHTKPLGSNTTSQETERFDEQLILVAPTPPAPPQPESVPHPELTPPTTNSSVKTTDRRLAIGIALGAIAVAIGVIAWTASRPTEPPVTVVTRVETSAASGTLASTSSIDVRARAASSDSPVPISSSAHAESSAETHDSGAPAATRPRQPRCTPPFYYEKGIKTYKPGCL